MTKHLLLALTCACLALAVTACGEDEPAENNSDSTANNGTNNGDPNNGDPNNGDPNNGDPNNGDPNNGDPNNGQTNNGDPGPVEPGTPAEYAHYENGQGSRLNALVLLEDPVEGFDLNGDGEPDNGLGSLLGTIGNLVGGGDGGGVQGTIDAALADGSINIGAIFIGDVASGPVDLHMFALSANGDGTYSAEPLSFHPNSKTPLVRFAGSQISGGMLSTPQSDFLLNIPIAGLELSLVVSDARIVGDISTDATGVKLDDGYLVGAVGIDSIVDALNGFLTSDTCSCLGLSGEPINWEAGPLMACPQGVDTMACAGTDGEVCGTIVGACGLAINVVSASADVDLDGDGEPDAISLVVGVGMEGAVINGAAE